MEKTKGVKKGTKRGPYKPRNKQSNEETINKVNIEETAVNERIEPAITEQPKIESIDTLQDYTTNEPEILKLNTGNENTIKQSEPTKQPEPEPTKVNFTHTSGEEKLNSFFSEYQQTADEKPNDNTPQPTSNNFQNDPKMKMLINGYMLLSLCDVVFPYGIKFIFGLFDPRAKKVNAGDMKLEPEQRQALMNSADAVAQYVFEKANPMTVFIICLGLFYGSNFNDAMQRVKLEEKKK